MKREGKPKACSPPRLTEMIRKPAGNFSRQRSRLRLQDAMGLGGSDPDGSKAAIYNHYVAAVRLSMDRARLSYDMPFNKVPRSEISQIFATAQSLQPDLAKYEDDWATYEILRRNYYSRRHRSSKIVHLPAETKSLSLIPKPQGIFPHIKPLFKLRDAMGLGAPDPDRSKKALYIACREAVRYSADVANFGTSMKQVSRAQLEDVFASARKIQPELARYEDDWASAEILRQHVNSRRQYQNRLNRERRMVEADALERIAPP
ncbi:hypothetical protein PsYK624_014740 [Phanerochaete sordida]|uniref:Uncharacterized protein n=1 Tax=Phanerochaete sordida TaxID=48140 RepID=A0A9P3G0B6_9APHY|nr:hypothetical protein PsYK624_014740 [Phanerochaete sordida]